MNHDIDDTIPPFDDATREHEWLLQERAMRRERLHLDSIGDDARTRRYRLLARALREPLPHALPADFAQKLAAQVAASPAPKVVSNTRFEFTLLLALATVMVVAAGAVVAIYGDTWLPSFVAILPAPHTSANRWLLALIGCLGASWLLGRWQQAPRTATRR